MCRFLRQAKIRRCAAFQKMPSVVRGCQKGALTKTKGSDVPCSPEPLEWNVSYYVVGSGPPLNLTFGQARAGQRAGPAKITRIELRFIYLSYFQVLGPKDQSQSFRLAWP